eukprot:gene9007-9941_t
MGASSSVDFNEVIPGGGGGGGEASGRQRRRDYLQRKAISGQISSSIYGLVDKTMQKLVAGGGGGGGGRADERLSDSTFLPNWLSKAEADALYQHFSLLAVRAQPTSQSLAARSKYPMWCRYYGLPRPLDQALALDRWGSYHESWLRVEEPPEILLATAAKLRATLGLSDGEINSFLVNFYFNGEDCYIPAHRDTTACLRDGSSVNCLSLGATRDFVLCANEDLGKFQRETMTIHHNFRVHHGDLFAIGPQTNEDFLHSVVQDKEVKELRISIIFRSIDKSFLDKHSKEKEAIYANGQRRLFTAEAIVCKGINDPGRREHIADLINEREQKILCDRLEKESQHAQPEAKGNGEGGEEEGEERKEAMPTGLKTLSVDLVEKDLQAYYKGFGSTVPQPI